MDAALDSSVIVTTYNRADLLQRCLDSVCGVSAVARETVVVDDGSTDATQSVVARFAGLVTYIRRDHAGIASARNAGCRAARGKYIAFVDDDDLLHPSRLSRLGAALRQHPTAVCAVCQGTEVDEAGLETGHIVWKNLPPADRPVVYSDCYDRMTRAAITLTPLNTLFSREAGEAVGWFDEGFVHGCEDTDFFMRLCETGDVVYVPETLTLVGRSATASLTRDWVRMAFSKLKLLEKHRRRNLEAGAQDRVRNLQARQYGVLRSLCDTDVDIRRYQQEYGIRLHAIARQLPLRALLYLAYCRYVGRRLGRATKT